MCVWGSAKSLAEGDVLMKEEQGLNFAFSWTDICPDSGIYSVKCIENVF